MSQPVTQLFLALSGALSLAIGLSVLVIPHAFFASNHIVLGSDPNLMSEIRAPGGLLLAAGLVMLWGVVSRRDRLIALQTSIVVFGMYGISRLLSLILDGVPSTALLIALAIELVLCGVAIFLSLKLQQSK
ncbi:MAG: DUF4345 domain-containing protein [Cognatishimia sp.]|nr:DUF4345 domain-containing protein [Cognatishimia sp.]NQY40207.1 DUF4345 domain-containing protein [Henriciella sp.]